MRAFANKSAEDELARRRAVNAVHAVKAGRKLEKLTPSRGLKSFRLAQLDGYSTGADTARLQLFEQ
jgi:hypothetical protein